MANSQSDAFRGRCPESNSIYSNLYQELIWQLWRHPFSSLCGKGNGLSAGSDAIQTFTSGASSILGAGLGPARQCCQQGTRSGTRSGERKRIQRGLKAVKPN